MHLDATLRGDLILDQLVSHQNVVLGAVGEQQANVGRVLGVRENRLHDLWPRALEMSNRSMHERESARERTCVIGVMPVPPAIMLMVLHLLAWYSKEPVGPRTCTSSPTCSEWRYLETLPAS